MEEWDFRGEIQAIQLPCKVSCLASGSNQTGKPVSQKCLTLLVCKLCACFCPLKRMFASVLPVRSKFLHGFYKKLEPDFQIISVAVSWSQWFQDSIHTHLCAGGQCWGFFCFFFFFFQTWLRLYDMMTLEKEKCLLTRLCQNNTQVCLMEKCSHICC